MKRTKIHQCFSIILFNRKSTLESFFRFWCRVSVSFAKKLEKIALAQFSRQMKVVGFSTDFLFEFGDIFRARNTASDKILSQLARNLSVGQYGKAGEDQSA